MKILQACRQHLHKLSSIVSFIYSICILMSDTTEQVNERSKLQLQDVNLKYI